MSYQWELNLCGQYNWIKYLNCYSRGSPNPINRCVHTEPSMKFAWSYTQQNMTVNWIRQCAIHRLLCWGLFFHKSGSFERRLWFCTIWRLISIRYWNITTTTGKLIQEQGTSLFPRNKRMERKLSCNSEPHE